MAKRVFIIHGWGGGPKQDWLDWLKHELEKKDFEVYVPEMPDTWSPTISKWVAKLQEITGEPDKNTYFIGHSIGCQAIMRYLEKIPAALRVGGAIFVAGWFNLTNETWDEAYTQEIADQWVNTPINFEKIKKHTDKILVVNSSDDPYVPLGDADLFNKYLGAKVIMKDKMGHITESDGIVELPVVLEEVLTMAK